MDPYRGGVRGHIVLHMWTGSCIKGFGVVCFRYDQVVVLIPKGMVNKKRLPVVGGPLFI